MKKLTPRRRFEIQTAILLSVIILAYGNLPSQAAVPDLAIFIGRFHPLIVHMPIGFLAVLLVLEAVVAITRTRHDAGIHVVLWFTVLASIASTAVGTLLAFSGGYDSELLGRHRWLGLASTIATVWMLLMHRASGKSSVVGYRALLVLTLGLVGATGHMGGALTHGENYLTDYLPPLLGGAPPPEPIDTGSKSDAAIFVAAIQPMLQQKCVSCHTPEKSTGDLRLHDFASLIAGGKSGPAIVPGDASASLTIQRIHLPESDKKHMPPKGKPQLSEAESDLLAWWIDQGARERQAIGDDLPADGALALLESRLGFRLVQPRLDFLPWEGVVAAAEPFVSNPDIRIRRISLDSPAISVVAEPGAKNVDALIDRLAPLRANITLLDLDSASITDDALVSISRFTNLNELRLQNTTVSDGGISMLDTLRQLQKINLYGTPTTDAALNSLKNLPKLRHIVASNTGITEEAAKAFVKDVVDEAKQQRIRLQIHELESELSAMNVEVVGTEPVPKTLINDASWDPETIPTNGAWRHLVFPLGAPLPKTGTYELTVRQTNDVPQLYIHDVFLGAGNQVLAGSFEDKTLTKETPIQYTLSVTEFSTNQAALNILVHSEATTSSAGTVTLTWIHPKVATSNEVNALPEVAFHRDHNTHGDLISGLAAVTTSTTSKQHDPGTPRELVQGTQNNSRFAFCTEQEKDPWVQFTLPRRHLITAIIIDNRRDGYTDRTKGMVLESSADGKTWTPLWSAGEPQAQWAVDLSETDKSPRDTKLLRIRAQDLNNYFHLAQVRFWGIPTERAPEPPPYIDERGVLIGPRSKVTTSSTSIYDRPQGLKRLTQLATNNLEFAFHTSEEMTPWVQFLFESPVTISAISIENRIALAERAAGLVFESSRNGTDWQRLWTAVAPEESWHVDIASEPETNRTATLFRLRVNNEAPTFFHLRKVLLWAPLADSGASAMDLPAKTGQGAWTYTTVPNWGKIPGHDHIGSTHGGIVVANNGNVHVSTDGPHGIIAYKEDGTFIKSLGDHTQKYHGLNIYEEDGREVIYAAAKASMIKLSLDGDLLLHISGGDQWQKATAVAVAPNGDIFIADGYGSSVIFKYNREGTFLKKFGVKGADDGQLNVSHGLALDNRDPANPVLIVCDRENHRLQLFDLEGNFLRVAATDLRRPCALSIWEDHMVVAELAGRAVILDKEYQIVSTLGDNPQEDQRANFKVPPEQWVPGVFTAPHGCAFDAKGNIYIEDWNQVGRITKLVRTLE